MNSRRIRWLEPLAGMGLAGLAGYFLATSWRKWPDPLVDFGRELYLPWRLANGAVLYRDVDDFYGPLSQYLNAGLFRWFGPGLMVLVAANLLVFAAIVAAIYFLFRRAWGAGAAVASSAVFIAVFGFSQYGRMGNFNYATPYAHEVTHGVLICLLLVLVLSRWIGQTTLARSFLMGGLFGLTLVLKPEIMLAAGLVTGTAVALRWRQRGPVGPGAWIAWGVGALLPTAGFTLLFSAYFPWREAATLSSKAWLNVTSTTRFTSEFFQRQLLGFDRPWPNLLQHLVATLLAVLLIAGLCGVARLADRVGSRGWRLLLCGFVVGGTAWLALIKIEWLYAGSCLLGLILIYLLSGIITLARKPAPEVDASRGNLRLLLTVLSAALMARMILHGKIFELGFYQAALASLLVPAVLIGELPARLGAGRWGRALLVTASVVLLGCGTVQLAVRSQEILRLKVFSVGKAPDNFYAVDPQLDPASEVIEFICEKLQQYPPGGTLLVLPDGVMINYLTRRPSPVAPFVFFSYATSGGIEDELVLQLQRHPPDAVVVVSRDLRPFRITRWGQQPGQGRELLHWVTAHYKVAWHIGGDPLDPNQIGGLILTRARN